MTLKEAVAAAVGNARANCERCRADADWRQCRHWWSDHRQQLTPPDFEHTCHGAIAAWRDVALAAVDASYPLTEELGRRAKAKIKELFGKVLEEPK